MLYVTQHHRHVGRHLHRDACLGARGRPDAEDGAGSAELDVGILGVKSRERGRSSRNSSRDDKMTPVEHGSLPDPTFLVKQFETVPSREQGLSNGHTIRKATFTARA